MPRDLIAERALIYVSRVQCEEFDRLARWHLTMLDAGIPAAEAQTIIDEIGPAYPIEQKEAA